MRVASNPNSSNIRTYDKKSVKRSPQVAQSTKQVNKRTQPQKGNGSKNNKGRSKSRSGQRSK